MKQYIVDIEGNLLEVLDLKEAIFQVAMYLTYEIENPTGEQLAFHKKRIIYWKDIFMKLNLLKEKTEIDYLIIEKPSK